MPKLKFEKQRSLFERKGFYIALAICLIAAGSASYAAISTQNKNSVIDETPSVTFSVAEDVNKVVSDQPYPESILKDESKEVSSEETKKAESADESIQSRQFFVMPLGGEIIKDFSEDDLQYSETYKDWRLHKGTDIAGEKGAAVCSCSDGTVTDITDDPMYGMTVIIDHGNGVVIKYCGLNAEPTVEVGSIVEAGTQIGALGDIPCESVERIHLHIEITVNGREVAPANFIKSYSIL